MTQTMTRQFIVQLDQTHAHAALPTPVDAAKELVKRIEQLTSTEIASISAAVMAPINRGFLISITVKPRRRQNSIIAVASDGTIQGRQQHLEGFMNSIMIGATAGADFQGTTWKARKGVTLRRYLG